MVSWKKCHMSLDLEDEQEWLAEESWEGPSMFGEWELQVTQCCCI